MSSRHCEEVGATRQSNQLSLRGVATTWQSIMARASFKRLPRLLVYWLRNDGII